MKRMRLYSYFNSSTSYRVRIALALKNLEYEYVPVDIRHGHHRDSGYVDRINPSAGVPALIVGEGDERIALGQSLAIIDYLDGLCPEPRLIPLAPTARARVLELANLIACDIHPVNNLRVLRYLQGPLHVTEEQKNTWYGHWIAEGLSAVERLVSAHGAAPYCFGAEPSLADCCLIPQIANALRMGCETAAYPKSMAVYHYATQQPAFAKAAPNQQPDFGR
jgi:maleylacetoacetate isomerase